MLIQASKQKMGEQECLVSNENLDTMGIIKMGGEGRGGKINGVWLSLSHYNKSDQI